MALRSPTRGYGFLEAVLARRRAGVANRLIPPASRAGRILDIGCGVHPYFLARTRFAERIGIDKVVSAGGAEPVEENDGLRLMSFDIESDDHLPLRDESVDVVTMLAVFEHLEMSRLLMILDEIERVLKPGGTCIMTTPAGWTGPLLTVLKWLRLVSAVEIDEHHDSYTRKAIDGVLARTRLRGMPTRYGCFELGMNTWVKVDKPGR